MVQTIARDGVSFGPLSRAKSDGTLWTGRAVEIPAGELTGAERTAWLRGVLLACFGAPQRIDADKTTFEYELEAVVDGEHAVRLGLADVKAEFGGSFGRFVHGSVDEALLRRVERALLPILEETRPADYQAKFYEYAVRRYGCSNGMAWVGTKKNGRADCHRFVAGRAQYPRTRFAIVGDPPPVRAAAASLEITEEQLAAYYERHAPAGAAPLAAMRSHVLHALRSEHTHVPPLRFESRAIAEVIETLGNLALFDFVPVARAFQESRDSEWTNSERGRAKLERLSRRIRAILDGSEREPPPSPHSLHTPLAAHPGVWSEVAAELDGAVRFLDETTADRFRIFRIVA